ncbi:type II secretion system protein [Sutcliffiella horikoshii]|uniref:Type II secretion system protein n=1 Tax=Sutcliffiella horikoshii TaxID=79883 RepID=A0AA95B625_9BACI|nr:type II secretion system protein [Sutcliffiella horikoshii]TYS59088.1 type II secretion system protein [Sutcliffiella horikoshii]
MLQKCRKMLRNEKGLTLIELLAVVVILGIIAAIAVPSIGALIDNSKRDAHVANARQMINSTKLAVASDKDLQPTSETDDKYISLKYLIDSGYIEDITDKSKDPNGFGYVTATTPETTFEAPNGVSYVKIETTDGKQFTYSVKLVSEDGDDDYGITTEVSETSLDRESATANQ